MKSTAWTAGGLVLVLACGAGVVAQDSKATTAPARGTTGASYVLKGDSGEPGEHVGHEIEVIGFLDTTARLVPPAVDMAVATSGTAGAVAEDTKNRAASAAAMPELRVESVRMISANCST